METRNETKLVGNNAAAISIFMPVTQGKFNNITQH
jgi:hypothetical protein